MSFMNLLKNERKIIIFYDIFRMKDIFKILIYKRGEDKIFTLYYFEQQKWKYEGIIVNYYSNYEIW